MSPPPIKPFTDVGATHLLYTDERRVARRTGALHAAKVRGEDAAAKIAGPRRHPRTGCPDHCGRGLRSRNQHALSCAKVVTAPAYRHRRILKLLEVIRQHALTDLARLFSASTTVLPDRMDVYDNAGNQLGEADFAIAHGSVLLLGEVKSNAAPGQVLMSGQRFKDQITDAIK
jgi:hypothetical protein